MYFNKICQNHVGKSQLRETTVVGGAVFLPNCALIFVWVYANPSTRWVYANSVSFLPSDR